MRILIALFFFLFLGTVALAVDPKGVFILTNSNTPESKELAEHYCKARKVPTENIIVLDLPIGEDLSRVDYNNKLRDPLRKALKDKQEQVQVLLSIYGVPLRVGGELPSEEEKAEIVKVDAELGKIRETIKQLDEKLKKAKDDKADPKEITEQLSSERTKEQGLTRKRNYLAHSESQAAVDSELMLLWHEKYELRRWQLNPMYFQTPKDNVKGATKFIMTCRLDGPTPKLVKSIIDTSLEVEGRGLKGKVYVDARGIKFNMKGDTGHGYGGYDESMREMAQLLEKEAKMPVVLDDKPEVFAVDTCPECAIYCGWYSHAKYVDSFKFEPGAIAWHLASSEAVSLRNPKATYWCKNLLERGVVATLGPVAEPYTVGFPKPAEFFGFLATGKYTLVECYAKTVLFGSWMGTLVGDPLYNPFEKVAILKEEKVLPSPKGGIFLRTK